MRRTVIITGCHRSGTSCVAGMLAAATSIDFGRVNRQYLADNPRGNYEHPDVVDLNDELVGGWKTPRALRFGDDDGGRVRAIVEREYPDVEGVTYGIKDPRFLFTLPLWKPHLGDVTVVLVTRTPGAVIDSLIRRERTIYGRELSEQTAAEIWAKYNDQIVCIRPFDIHVRFSANLDSILSTLGDFVEGTLGLDWNDDAARNFYSRTLVHHK